MTRRRLLPKAALAGAVLLCLAVVLSPRGQAAPEDKVDAGMLRLEVMVSPGDPFDPANEAKKGSGEPLKVRRGQTVWVQLNGAPQAGFHTYPVSVKTAPGQEELSKLTVGTVKGVVPLGDVIESEPSKVTRETKADGKKTTLEHDKPFTWAQEVFISSDAAPGKIELPLNIKTQVCDEKHCVPFRSEVRAIFEVTDEPPLELSTELQKRVAAKAPAVPPPSPPSPGEGAKSEPPAKQVEHGSVVGRISASPAEYKARMETMAQKIIKRVEEPDAGLLAFILTGIFWGGVSLITPCVFPMIPITVSFFLKQSEKEHHRPVVMASVYSLTIIIVLTLAAAFLLSVFRWLSINPLMNYGLGALFVFFALSLFGMYEIELPSGLARFTSAREGQGGLVGTMFMALTFTIISFACVAPFLGGFGGTAAAARPLWHNLLGGLAFAATFAAPFFVLALFPTLLKALPKSGAWLNSVKVVMGFLELAAAFKFFRGAELLQSGGEVTLFSYDLVLGIWIALAVLCGLYLIGVYRLPHDTPAENIGVPRLLFSAAFFGLALYLTPALFKVNNEGAPQRPGGAVYAWVDAFLLPESGGGDSAKDLPKTGDLMYAVEQAQEYYKRTGQPKRLFVDFTGLVCTNCRINEKDVFPRPEVQRAFRQYINVELYTDKMPADLYAPASQADLAKDNSRLEEDAVVNAEFEQKVFDEITLPLYAILEPQPDGRILIVDVFNEGRIQNVAEFVRFVTGARAKEKAAP
jgi:thiol:disulfide interchange protein DsbD